ncbi:MAG: pectate lyase [Fibrobacter sp.]|nr:pectate lyase [Fibrobacter sp.]
MNAKLKNALAASVVLALCALDAQAAVDQCKPIGWATRSGRTATAFEVTGGGNVAADTVRSFSQLQNLVKGTTPKVIYIDGTLGDGWLNRSGSRLVIDGQNKTIVGLKAGTKLNACIRIAGSAKNIILRNIVIEGPGSNADQAWDNIVIEGSSGKYPTNIWVDHCEFWDGQDGNADVVKGADNVTFTWCKFGYKKRSTHNLSNLIGSSDSEPESEGKLNVTYAFNWWVAAAQRKPRCRYGNIHVMNNLITADANISAGTDVLGMAPGYQCRIRSERNHFINEREPIYLGLSGTIGVAEVIDNKYTSCSGNTKGNGSSFTPPYDYTGYMLNVNDVEAAVKANAGATLSSPTVCDANYVPPTPPEPVVEKAYQAEKGTVNGGFLESSNAGFAGTGYVNFDKDGDLVVNVSVEKYGVYQLDIDFTNGSSETRSLDISSSGTLPDGSAVADKVTEAFAKTSAWTEWKTLTTKLTLGPGENEIKFATVGGNDGPNLDQFDLKLLEEIKVPELPKDTAVADTSTKDTSVTVPTGTDSTAVDTSDADHKESVVEVLRMNVPAVQEVLVFDLNGNAVRRIPAARALTASECTRGLPAGRYIVQMRSTGLSKSFVVLNR